MSLVHIRKAPGANDWNGAAEIRRGVSGWFTLEDGRMASPAVAGFVDGNDKIVPFESVTIDNSTGSDTTATTVRTVEDGRVLVTTTIRDMTAQEMDDQQTARVASETDMVLAKALLKLLNDFRESQSLAPVSVTQFKAWMKAQL